MVNRLDLQCNEGCNDEFWNTNIGIHVVENDIKSDDEQMKWNVKNVTNCEYASHTYENITKFPITIVNIHDLGIFHT